MCNFGAALNEYDLKALKWRLESDALSHAANVKSTVGTREGTRRHPLHQAIEDTRRPTRCCFHLRWALFAWSSLLMWAPV
jgi:hypothetical protein